MAIEDIKGKPGRPKGSRNKVTTEIKDAILGSFNEVGGQDYLTKVALEDPKTYCALLGKVLPKDMNLNINEFDGMTDEQLMERYIELEALMEPHIEEFKTAKAKTTTKH